MNRQSIGLFPFKLAKKASSMVPADFPPRNKNEERACLRPTKA